ncbi:MAG: hypothetical protein OEL89_04925, partial [Candidatus Peregrinibacteria bacterium]|nr:hypothetical protein [Candidatus Peregrinibacteria bacterium]
NIEHGQTNFYKAEIVYPKEAKGQFYIEAKGDQGAYGLLDPWYDTVGLVGYWSFNGGDMDWAASTAEAIDQSGSGNDGDVANGASPAIGKVGQALEFDGVDGYIDIADADHFSFGNGSSDSPFTFSAWVYVESGGMIIAKSQNLTSWIREYTFHVDPSTNNLNVVLYDNGGISSYVSEISDEALSTGEWHHVLATYDGTGSTGIKLYIDGGLASSSTVITGTYTAMANTSRSLEIGRQRNDSGSQVYFNGKIDEALIYNRALSATEITDIYNLGNRKFTQQSAIKTGLAGHWPMDEDSLEWADTGTEVKDESGQANHGDAVNLTSGNVQTGRLDESLSFGGVSDYISVADNASLDPGGPMTMTAWVKPTSADLVDQIICKASTDLGGYQLRGNSGAFTVYIGSTGVGSVAYTQGEWYHLVGLYDGTNTKFYVNGTLRASAPGAGPVSNSSPLLIGKRWDGYYFNGNIDDVRVYDRAISETEIANLYNVGKLKINSSKANLLTTGLVGSWTFDGGDISLSGGAIVAEQIPTMTSSTTSGVTIDESTVSNSRFGWHVGRDDAETTIWHSSAAPPQWVRVDFGSGNAKIITSYTIKSSPTHTVSAPITWTLDGSADGSSWTTIDTRSSQASWGAGEIRTFDVTNDSAYQYYRINTTVTDANLYVAIAEMELIGVDAALALDSSGNGNSGVMNNGVAPVIGKVGQALSFDGVDDYISISDSANLTTPSGLTLAAWVKPTSNNYVSVLSKYSTGNREYALNVDCDGDASSRYLSAHVYDESQVAFLGRKKESS